MIRRLLPLALAAALLLAGCGQAWADVDRAQDITDAILAERMGNYTASGWSDSLEKGDRSWRYTAAWTALTGARKALRLEVDRYGRLELDCAVEGEAGDTIAALVDPEGQVQRLSPGVQTVDLPDGRCWLVVAAVGTGGGLQLDACLTDGDIRAHAE